MFNKISIAYIITIALFMISGWLGVSIGSVNIPLEVLWNPQGNEINANILWKIRVPRVLIAALVGASLAIAGAAFQGLLKNPLADPYTLGVSSGASVGAVITIFFGISIPFLGVYTLPIFSMVGACITMVLVMGFTRLVDRSMKKTVKNVQSNSITCCLASTTWLRRLPCLTQVRYVHNCLAVI